MKISTICFIKSNNLSKEITLSIKANIKKKYRKGITCIINLITFQFIYYPWTPRFELKILHPFYCKSIKEAKSSVYGFYKFSRQSKGKLVICANTCSSSAARNLRMDDIVNVFLEFSNNSLEMCLPYTRCDQKVNFEI